MENIYIFLENLKSISKIIPEIFDNYLRKFQEIFEKKWKNVTGNSEIFENHFGKLGKLFRKILRIKYFQKNYFWKFREIFWYFRKYYRKFLESFQKLSKKFSENFENYYGELRELLYHKISEDFEKYVERSRWVLEFFGKFREILPKKFRVIFWKFLEIFRKIKLFRKFSVGTTENFKKYFGKSCIILRNNWEIFKNYFLKFWESNFEKLWKLFWKISRNISGGSRIKIPKNFAEESKF